MSQQFCLKWNNHTTNMLQVFESLLSTEALVDVTLACDGLSLKAHKMVLSACSPFFQSLFLENPCKHPIVIMKDMRYCDLKAIIDFMYRGEVNVSHDQLSALLKTAETLKVKGLAEVTGENRHASGIVQQEITQQQQQSTVSTPTPTPLTPTAQRTDTPPLQGKRKRGRPRKRSLSDSNRSDDEGVAAKIKERDSPDVEELSGDASMDATSDIRSGGGPGSSNSQSQVHSSNNVNSFSKSHLSISQDPQVDETSGDENEFEVEPSKLLEQTLTTDNVPSSSQNSTGHIQLPSVSGLEISRRSMSSTDSLSQALVPASDSLGSNLQAPDSPQDIKPQILSFDDPPISPVAGPSHSERSMMMYMDQSGVSSIPGPSNYQDNSALVPHDSQPQGLSVGEGEFGSVLRGRWINPDNIEVAVAVKRLRDEQMQSCREEFIREVEVMGELNHCCIVKLIGVCLGPPLMMVQELVPMGSLLDYVLDHSTEIHLQDMLIWSAQIAWGMTYLESKRFVHRDLAARNILLASKTQAKISDFGLSRALRSGSEYYRASTGGRWPVKWYAPESINYGTFSHASDMWSYGITLWEIITLGEPPYGDMTGTEVIQLIEANQRLEIPETCPVSIKSIIQQCWLYMPESRPTFKMLYKKFCSEPEYCSIWEFIK